ncbi:hypothetical protein [Bremerella sp. P1]|uniref:hypothetical protein n=1 Tax=Bremerella sp. P1 TaxID=3026424 RepID=UPI0023684EFA|nr:hypothetical protein [Bremerella sp. P1]WDI42069.1 hypothetical protein PSR63_26810 [Bremerella sp. P1]
MTATRMEMTAHQMRFGINDEDEPFAFLWAFDSNLDFVFSVSRPINDNDAAEIEFMVLDQIWEPVDDFDCRIDDTLICALVPPGLRRHTNGSKEIVVNHNCVDHEWNDLIDVLRRIFKGKTGLEVLVK